MAKRVHLRFTSDANGTGDCFFIKQKAVTLGLNGFKRFYILLKKHLAQPFKCMKNEKDRIRWSRIFYRRSYFLIRI